MNPNMFKDILNAVLPGQLSKVTAIVGIGLTGLLCSVDPALLPSLQMQHLPPIILNRLLLLGVSVSGSLLLVLICVLIEYYDQAERYKKRVSDFQLMYKADRAHKELRDVIEKLEKMPRE